MQFKAQYADMIVNLLRNRYIKILVLAPHYGGETTGSIDMERRNQSLSPYVYNSQIIEGR